MDFHLWSDTFSEYPVPPRVCPWVLEASRRLAPDLTWDQAIHFESYSVRDVAMHVEPYCPVLAYQSSMRKGL
jgi:hypothetical protein